MKDVTKLSAADFRAHPVWRYTGRDTPSETMVEPVKKLPVKTLAGALAGVEVTLASGKKIPAFLGNIDVERPRSTEQFITLSVFGEHGRIFHLARYHDFDFAQSGPAALVVFLKMTQEEIFPISWDVRHLISGTGAALHGQILAEPKERLSRADWIALAVP